MTAFHITEASTVQMPMVRHAAEIGWTPVWPQDALARRGGPAGLLFRGELEEALHRLNPWLNANAARSVIERLESLPPSIEGNRQMLEWLRGERQWYDDAEQCQKPVQLIDFETTGTNVLEVTWEWTLKPPARKGNRADVMFLVNGVPIAIVENKNPKDADAIDRGIGQLLRYERETPELLGAAQLFNVTHLLDYWYGVTWNASRRYMARWKERPEESYRFAVQSFFEPTDFLRTLRDWILFYVEDGETRKSVLAPAPAPRCRAASSSVARSRPSGADSSGTHRGPARPSPCSPPPASSWNARISFRTPQWSWSWIGRSWKGSSSGWVERLLGEMQQQDIPVWRASSRAGLRDPAPNRQTRV